MVDSQASKPHFHAAVQETSRRDDPQWQKASASRKEAGTFVGSSGSFRTAGAGPPLVPSPPPFQRPHPHIQT